MFNVQCQMLNAEELAGPRRVFVSAFNISIDH
jgi:hypothetical protein